MKTLKPIKWVKKSENNWSGGKNIVIRKCQDYFRAYIKIDDVFTSSPKFKTLEAAKGWCQRELQERYNSLKKQIEEMEIKIGVKETEYTKWCKNNMEKIRANWKLIDPVIGEINNEN